MDTNRGRGAAGGGEPKGRGSEDGEEAQPRFPAAQVRRRVEPVAAEPVGPSEPEAVAPERGAGGAPGLGARPTLDDDLVVEPGPGPGLGAGPGPTTGRFGGGPFGSGSFGSMFGPRSFGGGRLQVWGCSPGCLIASLVGSIFLTLVLNGMLGLFF
jgi:hypothetical protein